MSADLRDYLELIAEATAERSFYDPAAIWLHGGPAALDGAALKRYGKDHSDMGGLFFCKDNPVGRWYAATYAGAHGRVWQARLGAPVDSICDLTNRAHRARLQAALSRQEYANILATRGASGHLDWAVVDEDLLEPLGFRGCVFQERPAGMATGLPPESGLATLPEPVLSIGLFHAADAHLTGFVPPDQVWDLFR